METKETQPFEITLPEGKTYNDLNEAHQADSEDEGNREESLYPLKQAQLDNSESYRSEMTLADTRELINKLKSRLQALKGNDGEGTETSEFNVRTGNDEGTKQSLERRMDKKEENFDKQDATTKYYIDEMGKAENKDKVGMLIRWAELRVMAKDITDSQMQEINEAADAKRSEFSAATTKYYIDRISKAENKDKVGMLIRRAELYVMTEDITDSQMQEITNTATNRTAEIREGVDKT